LVEVDASGIADRSGSMSEEEEASDPPIERSSMPNKSREEFLAASIA